MINVIAWLGVGFGTLVGAFNVIQLTAGRARPELTEPGARSKVWSSLLTCLLVTACGGSLLGSEAKNDAIVWVARLAIFAVVGVMLVLWVRSRTRGKPAGPDH